LHARYEAVEENRDDRAAAILVARRGRRIEFRRVDRLDRIGFRGLAAALTSLACQRGEHSEAFAQKTVWSSPSRCLVPLSEAPPVCGSTVSAEQCSQRMLRAARQTVLQASHADAAVSRRASHSSATAM